MNFETNTWSDYSSADGSLADGVDHGPSADAVDDWLEDALRAVPLPAGFFERLSRLADSPPKRADDRDRDGHLTPTRGVAGPSRRYEPSSRKI